MFDVSLPSSRRGLVIAMVASFIFIVLLRFLAGIMVWVMIVMVILVLGYGERVVGSFSLLSPFSFPYLKWALHEESSCTASFQVSST